jgi:hypothetical protein
VRYAAELHRQQALELSHLRLVRGRRAAPRVIARWAVLGALAVAAGVTLAAAETAAGQTPGSATHPPATRAPVATPADPNALVRPASFDERPRGRVRTAREVLIIAGRTAAVRRTLRRHRGAYGEAYLKGPLRWQVSYFDPPRGRGQRKEIAQVLIDDRTGAVLEAWTGFQVAWSMARGYPGAFGRKASSLYVWLPLCVLFLAPFVTPRRPLRMLHLDLLAILSFSISLAFFSRGNIGWSVPLAYPPLLYLLVRLLLLSRRRTSERLAEPLRLNVPLRWLVVALIFLVGFRVGLNVTNSNVIDVGYAGVIGADRLADGTGVYGKFPRGNEHGDTYGPVNYYAYVPFEQALPWSGVWDDLPAAHGAAVAFDLLTLLGLFLLGRRIRGPTLGVVLAYAWAACPFTLFALSSNANDGLVAMLLVAALLVASSPPARGAVLALAGLTKFAPLGLAPLFATHGLERGRRLRGLAAFTLAFAATAAVAMLPVLLGGDLRVFYERTLEYQADRGSPFSVWGFRPGLDGVQTGVQVAGIAFALVAAVLPRRRDLVGLAAMAGAVLIGLQLGVTHWFYLYVAWFLPLVLLAVLGRFAAPAPAPAAVAVRETVPAPA